jgi:hypothetical protein
MPLVPVFELWPRGTELSVCWWILLELVPLWVATVIVTWVHTEIVVDSTKRWISKCSIPVRWTSSFIILYCFRILQQSQWSIGQCCLQNFIFSSASLLDHTMYAVSVWQDGGFEFTKKGYNLEQELQRYVEDSGVIKSIPIVVNAKIDSEWVINSHWH